MHILIMMGYLLISVLIGIYSSKNAKGSKAFLGADLGILLCVVSGAGEWMGGTSTTGVSEYGFTYGISGAWYTIANGIGITFLAFFFAKLYRSLETVTVPGIIGKYIGRRSRSVSSILLILVMLIVGSSQMVAVGTLGQTLLSLHPVTSIVILGSGVILYTFLGGMLAVGYTNIFHMIFMYGGIIIAVIYSFQCIGGIDTLTKELPASYLSFSAIGKNKIYSWVIASILGACTAQAGIQPILAAKNEDIAVRSSFIIALLVAPFGILTALLGMVARVKFPELNDAKLALPTLMASLHPVISGIVLASILAAILSTASPIFLSSGTLFVKDILPIIKPSLNDDAILSASKKATIMSGFICMVIAIGLYHSAMILDIVYFAYSIRGSIFVVLLLGIFWKHTLEKGAVAAMIITGIVGVFWVVYRRLTGVYPISNTFTETYAAIVTAFLVTVIGSLIEHMYILKHQHGKK